MKKKQEPLLGKIFRKIAPKIGATIVIEPEWNIVGQIIFKNGRKRYFRGSTLDLNPVGASDIAKDKDYATFFMKRMGYPTVPGKTFFSNDWGRDTIIRAEDKRISENLKRQGYTMRSIIPRGERVYLLDNANLSTGGDAVDVTAEIHPEFRRIAIRLTRDMGLRLCGVDLMVDGDITEKPRRYWVLEVNAAPGLDHYVRTGKAQEKIVEDMYLEVLKAMQ